MLKNSSYLLLTMLCLSSCAKNNFFRKESNNNPGYYEQWFREHKNEQGVIPEGMIDRWYAHDKAQITGERGGFTIVSKVSNLAANDLHGGRTRAILVSSLDSNRVFVGSVSGGLWRSENGGLTWSMLNDQSSNLSVTCITENPFNPKEIYYGSGEVRGGVMAGNGIHKSEDGGLTFNRLASTATLGDMQYCNYIEHSVVDSSTVWVGTSKGLYVTKNSGQTWKKISSPFGSSSVSGLISFPDSSMMVSIISGKIYKSPKGDLTPFKTVPDSIFPKANLGRILIANCKNMPDVVYAFFTGNEYLRETDRGVFRSNDGGSTWYRPFTDTIKVGSAQQMYCQALGVSPKNPDFVIIGAQNAKYSRNGGKNWTTFNSGHADNHVFYPTGKNSNEFFMGNDGGIYKHNWFTLANSPKDMSKGYTSSQYYAGNYSVTGKICVGGTQDNGSWRYVNGALAKMAGADGGYAHLSQQEQSLVYYSYQNGTTFRRSNYLNQNGEVWITPSGGAEYLGQGANSGKNPNFEGVDFINEYQMNYADGKQLYFRTNKGIWRTTNRGTNWEKLNQKNITAITAIGVANQLDPTVYVGGAGTFYRIDSAATRKSNATLVNSSSKLPSAMRASAWGTISFAPSDNTTMFVGLSSMTAQSRIWKGTNVHVDSLMKWTDLSGNLPAAMSVYQIQPHPDAVDSVLLAATAFGLYYTTNNGKTWTKDTRVPNVPIYEMKLRASDKNVFLFTHGRGVWNLELADLSNISKTNDFSTLAWKVYPNPAQNMLQIEADFDISQAQIFDISGREVLRNENSNQIDISLLTEGVYILKIFDQKGRFETKKFVKAF